MSNVFVAGATGVLGRRVVSLLVAAGHDVRGVARSPAKAALLRSLGAEPVEVDLFDAAAVGAAVEGSDVIVHLATSIPPLSKMRSRRAWRDNDRLRTETTRHLVDAALAHGIDRVVTESITFHYVDRGSDWIDEGASTDTAGALDSVGDLEREVARLTASGGTGVVLRFGLFYGPDARSTGEYLGLARRGLAVTVGSPNGYISSIHTDDAAAAVVAAIDAPPASTTSSMTNP
ncbi:MAG: NAD(P)H-binding protein [Acidimicrobiia bacterium]|nr:NAD(P)H-binding protein [Acidimicrobiia bacterium]